MALYTVETVQDFLIKLDIKPLMHLLEISIFSLDNVILRLTKVMNRDDKNCVVALLKIFMGLALVHFQNYWLLSQTHIS